VERRLTATGRKYQEPAPPARLPRVIAGRRWRALRENEIGCRYASLDPVDNIGEAHEIDRYCGGFADRARRAFRRPGRRGRLYERRLGRRRRRSLRRPSWGAWGDRRLPDRPPFRKQAGAGAGPAKPDLQYELPYAL